MSTVDAGQQRARWDLQLERYAPLALTALAGGVIALFGPQICDRLASGRVDVDNLYAAVLSWASIQIGFAFGVYGFVLGKTQGFIEAARDTTAMASFLRYVKRANVGGFVLTACSLPLAVIAPTPGDAYSPTFWVVTSWFCLFVWTFFAFLRIAFIFGQVTSVRDEEPFHGA
jgi:hypothetical protein